MKKVRKSDEGTAKELEAYGQANPSQATWEEFKNNAQEAYGKLQKQLFIDQRGLCAYCEVDLILTKQNHPRDFQVEHFHPKSDQETNHNWHLDWHNLLAVCLGGKSVNAENSVRLGVETLRYTHPDHSCDVKGERNLDGQILNPLTDINASMQIFGYNSYTGEIFVNYTCPANLQEKATRTIKELRLYANRLNRLRKEASDAITDEMEQLGKNGISEAEISKYIVHSHFSENLLETLPKFFTSIRAFLGAAAEKRLREINFDA